MKKTFDHLFLLGRPAAGKSEFIDFMKNTPEADRANIFHIGRFDEVDDFVWLWEKFLEDNLWEEAGFPRLYSHREGNNYGLNPDGNKLFDLVMMRFNKIIKDKYLANPDFYRDGTLFIEFSRGGNDGFAHAFSLLKPELFERAAILYIDVSFEESWRRNLSRYEEKLKHSILAHMCTRRAMEAFYQINDWSQITGGRENGLLELHGHKVPFVTMKNEPELKERGPLADRYGPALSLLMDLYNNR